MMRARATARALLAALLVLVLPAAASACAVCYGDADALMTKGMNNGILALLGVVAVVQIGFVALFVSIRRRVRQERERRARFDLIQGGAA